MLINDRIKRSTENTLIRASKMDVFDFGSEISAIQLHCKVNSAPLSGFDLKKKSTSTLVIISQYDSMCEHRMFTH